jgi:hypothetical protein
MKLIKPTLWILGIGLFLFSCATENTPGGNNSITVDGTAASWQQSALGWSASIGSNYTVTYKSSFYKSGAYPSITLAYGEHVYASYSQSDFFAFFTTGSKTFAMDPSSVGFTIYYAEGSGGPVWSSDMGSQTGSTVTFNTLTNQPASGLLNDRVKYTITVDAKMYNTSNVSDVKMISGTFEGAFERY